jgi:L-cysteine/cystine lyase
MREMIALQASRGRMSAAAVDAGRQRQAAVRSAVGRVLGRPAGEIAIAQSSTHAMNAVIWGLNLVPGDELVTTGMEHPGLVVPLAAAARRSGAVLRVVDVGDGSGGLEEVVRTACSPRTRLVALSHVSWLTGAVLDIRGAATAAHEVGAVVLVDGAQAAGAIAVDPVVLGVDAYAMPAQKWLLGPEGLGALWVSDAARDRLSVVFSGYETGTDHGWDGSLTMYVDARRFEASTQPEILLAGWAASIQWLEGLGWDAVHAATAAAARSCRRALDETDGVQVDPPRQSGSGLVAFSVPGVAPETAAAALAGQGVIVRPLPVPGQLRASCAFFTDSDDIKQLTEALKTLVAC